MADEHPRKQVYAKKSSVFFRRAFLWAALAWGMFAAAGCSVLDRQGEPQILDLQTDKGSTPSVGRKQEVAIRLVTDDPDNDELDFMWVATGGTFRTSGRDTLVDLFQDSVTVVWQAPAEAGIYDLFLELSDGASGAVVKSGLQVSVTQGPPMADAGADRLLAYLDTLTVALDGAGSRDPDGDGLRYVWQQVGGPSVRLVRGESAAPEFLAVAPADYLFLLTVTDDSLEAEGALSSEMDTVRIRVSDRGGRGN